MCMTFIMILHIRSKYTAVVRPNNLSRPAATHRLATGPQGDYHLFLPVFRRRVTCHFPRH
jgi:hypothetical protein